MVSPKNRISGEYCKTCLDEVAESARRAVRGAALDDRREDAGLDRRVKERINTMLTIG